MTRIKYNQDNMDRLNQKLSKLSAYFSDISTKMKPLKESSLVGPGATVIAGNISILESRASGNSRVITNGQNSFADGEIINESLIDSIEIPTDLKNVYSPIENNTKEVTLITKDGRSVNDGKVTQEQDVDLDKNINKEIIEDVFKDPNNQEEQELDNYKDAKKIGLEEVNNRTNTEEKELEDINGANIGLETVNNGLSTEEQELENIGETINNNLGSINKNSPTGNTNQNNSFNYSSDKEDEKNKDENDKIEKHSEADEPYNEWSDKE